MEYIDLGLPSKTLWAEHNSVDCTAFDLPLKGIPSGEQFKELILQCKLEACETEDGEEGMRFIGPNGNSIVLPLVGFGVPYYRLGYEPTEEEKKQPRQYLRTGKGRGFYRTKEWKDYHNVILSIDGSGYDLFRSENTYTFSVRTIKQN